MQLGLRVKVLLYYSMFGLLFNLVYAKEQLTVHVCRHVYGSVCEHVSVSEEGRGVQGLI